MDDLINDNSIECLITQFTVEELSKMVIRERRRKNELYKTIDKLGEENEQLKEDALLGEALRWYMCEDDTALIGIDYQDEDGVIRDFVEIDQYTLTDLYKRQLEKEGE